MAHSPANHPPVSSGAGVHRTLNGGALVFVYMLVLVGCFLAAYEIRWDFSVPADWAEARNGQILWVVPLKLILLLVFGQMRVLVYYFGLPDMLRIGVSLALAAVVMVAVWFLFNVGNPGVLLGPPRGVVLTDLLLGLVSIGAVRFSLRLYRERFGAQGVYNAPVRTAVVGAGDLGAALVHDALKRPSMGVIPVVFIDDDERKRGSSLHGVPILGPVERLREIALRHQAEKLVVTMPSASEQKLRAIIELGRAAGLPTEIVPSWRQLANGEVRIDRIRRVEIEDLLGRKPARLDTELIKRMIRGKTVLVTGAGGSIGSELARQILRLGVTRLLLLDQSEPALFTIEQELLKRGAGERVLPLVADILDEARLRSVFSEHGPQIVFHAAAHKHVPMMERQPSEALKNNTLGTDILCRLAQEAGVERFVLISTDKAINPTSVMGASKRLAELALQARQQAGGNRTRFMAVRFGNVIGSSGSVLPIFKQQIAEGGPVTVTHPEVTRYFMTIAEASGLVLQAGALGEGGEIFVLEMGEPVRIVDVARQLIELSGFRPDVDIKISFTGLRPGEKLYEEVQHNMEGCENTPHPQVRRLIAPPPAVVEVDAWLGELRGFVSERSPEALRAWIQGRLPEYKPSA